MQSPFDEDKNRPKTNDPKEFTQWTASQKALATIEDLKTHSNPPDFVIGADTVNFNCRVNVDLEIAVERGSTVTYSTL